MSNRILFTLSILTALFFVACEEEPDTPSDQPSVDVQVPSFNADSAYLYIENQVDFGPRVPNTPEHEACGEWLQGELERFGANVIVQRDKVTGYDGTKLNMMNIIGEFQPEKKRRILLMAHWDTRPWADKDLDESRQREPIPGANDGGSGVGVLLEIARQVQIENPKYGIDIIFFDVEDSGLPEFEDDVEDSGLTWCLGSQYWSQRPHKDGYRASFGILLDMVGSKSAVFSREGTSMRYAPNLVDKIWRYGRKTGNGRLFKDEVVGETTDDHLFVNYYAGIPSACIVEYHQGTQTMGLVGYGNFHHTHNDNMSIISKSTLKAVGQTVMHVIYNEGHK
jgi:hypothetical protein